MSKGIIFDQEYGYMFFLKFGFSMKVKLADIEVAIFEEEFLGLKGYSFLFKFKNEDEGDGGVLQSVVGDVTNNRYSKTTVGLNSNFSKSARFIQQTMDHLRPHRPRLIYFGARNEG